MSTAKGQHRRRNPQRGEAWVHVDRFDRPDGKVWAVQYWDRGKLRYEVARRVVLAMPSSTLYLGYRSGTVSAAIICRDATVVKTKRGLTVKPRDVR